MVSAVTQALIRSRSITATSTAIGLRLKQAGGGGFFDAAATGGLAQLSQFREQSANRERYGLFRGHIYSAVNAICLEAASQPVHVGRMQKTEGKDKDKPRGKKDWRTSRMTMRAAEKAARSEMEILDNHALLDDLEYPNQLQNRWSFVYSFVANLCLTGWAFVVGGPKKGGGFEFYSLPTTWIVPDHSKGAFSSFKVVNPKNPGAAHDAKPIDAKFVQFAHLPNPADPMAGLAPATSQYSAIKIDEYIQTCQQVFFENGIFPSVIVKMGTNPHPDVPAGVRPRLSAQQRRQVYAAIRKVSGGIANYGNPAIVDGLIESIEKLSMTQNEIGWEKSEKTIRGRILGAFGVHPFILGEDIPGSYAQAYIVQDRFFKRVNTFLDLLGVVMSGFVGEGEMIEEDEDLEVWWEPLKAIDPSMEKATWEQARTRDDVTQNEFRAWMGLPPDVDQKEAIINKGIVQHVAKIAADATAGTITVEQAQALLVGLGLPEEVAEEIAGEGPPEPPPGAVPGDPNAAPGAPGQPPQAPGQPGAPQQQQPGAAPGKKPKKPTPEEELESADLQLEAAFQLLQQQPRQIMKDLVERSSLIDYDEDEEKAWCPGTPRRNDCPPANAGGGKKPPAGGGGGGAAAKPAPAAGGGAAAKPATKPAKPAAAQKPPKGSGKKKPPKEGEKPADGKVDPNSPNQNSPIVRIQRKQALDTAKMLGFKPSSKDKWINEQQALEFLEERQAKRITAKAKKEGFKPTSSDDVINEMQARDFLRTKGNNKPKLNEASPKVQKAVAKIKQPPKTPEQRQMVMQHLKDAGVKKSDVWSNWKDASKQLMDYHLQNFKNEAVSKIEGSVAGILGKIFSNSALIARVSAMVLKEKQF